MKFKMVLIFITFTHLINAEPLVPQPYDKNCTVTETEYDAITAANRIWFLCELEESSNGSSARRCTRDHMIRILELNYRVEALLQKLRLGVQDVFSYRVKLKDANPTYPTVSYSCALIDEGANN